MPLEFKPRIAKNGTVSQRIVGWVSGCRSEQFCHLCFNSLQLDTFKKLLISYGKLSFSAVLQVTMHLVCSLPLAIKLFLSDNLLPRQAGACGVRFRLGTSHRKPAPRSGRAGFPSQVAFPIDVKSRERQHPGEKPQFCTGRSSHQPSMKKEQERQRGKPGAKIEKSNC